MKISESEYLVHENAETASREMKAVLDLYSTIMCTFAALLWLLFLYIGVTISSTEIRISLITYTGQEGYA